MYSYALLALAALAQANPVLVARQAVTAIISPSAPAPAGCTGAVSYSFGIVANNVSTAAVGKRQATQIADGQIQAATTSAKAVSQITDGQIQVATSTTKVMTVAPISAITDGQIQAGLHTMNIMAVAQPSPVAAVSQIHDGQIQAPAKPVSQITDGQIQAPVTTTMMPVTESKDGQPVAPTMPTAKTTAAVSSAAPVVSSAPAASSAPVASSTSSAAPQSSSTSTGGNSMVQCQSAFSITLAGSKLTDQNGRTGYIASNYQFQFDKPPQAGAIYTAGFSICGNGSLALGGSNIFYQCLSGNFYNLYDRKWAAQCSPVTVETMRQVSC